MLDCTGTLYAVVPYLLDVPPLEWLAEVSALPMTGCLMWPFARSGDGRGVVRQHGKNRQAYVVAWEFLHDMPWPMGMESRHLCHQPSCVNPLHIKPGTRRQNVLDRYANGTTKVTPDDIRAIRTDPRQQAEIAAEYGISRPLVANIKSGYAWGWIE